MIKFLKALWAWLTAPTDELSTPPVAVAKVRAKKRNLKQSGYATVVDALPAGARGIVNVPAGIDAASIRTAAVNRARKAWGKDKAIVEVISPTTVQIIRLP